MTPQQIRLAADAIFEMQNPSRIKASEYERNHADIRFKRRVKWIDAHLARVADSKELEEVYES